MTWFMIVIAIKYFKLADIPVHIMTSTITELSCLQCFTQIDKKLYVFLSENEKLRHYMCGVCRGAPQNIFHDP